MLDLYHLSGVTGTTTQDVFVGGPAGSAIIPQPWHKPRGKTTCHIFCVGSGGGGGAGFVGAASAAGGGAGGGSGAQCSVVLPLSVLPNMLYVFAGVPGTGGQTSGAIGGGGWESRVSLTPVITGTSAAVAIANGGGAGFGGAASGAATAGAAGTVTTIALQPYLLLHGLMTTDVNIAGHTGSAGGAPNSVGSDSIMTQTGLVVCGGAGGGGIGSTADGKNGGFIVGAGVFANINPGLGGAASGGHGNAGYNWKANQVGMFFSSGGSGGAGSAFNSATSGGNGGDGGFGSGGGGGGACLTGGTAGRGGNGGPGIVVITCW